MDGKGQLCPLPIQIKILTAGRRCPKSLDAAGFLRKGHAPGTESQNPERFGKNREGLYTSFPGTARDSPHQGHECLGRVGYGVSERAKL